MNIIAVFAALLFVAVASAQGTFDDTVLSQKFVQFLKNKTREYIIKVQGKKYQITDAVSGQISALNEKVVSEILPVAKKNIKATIEKIKKHEYKGHKVVLKESARLAASMSHQIKDKWTPAVSSLLKKIRKQDHDHANENNVKEEVLDNTENVLDTEENYETVNLEERDLIIRRRGFLRGVMRPFRWISDAAEEFCEVMVGGMIFVLFFDLYGNNPRNNGRNRRVTIPYLS